MKKPLAILFVFLILLSGMPLTLSTHYCNGKIVATKWSFGDNKANCGMPDKKPSGEKVIDIDCCHNNEYICTVEEDFTPPVGTQLPVINTQPIQVYTAPINIVAIPLNISNYQQLVFPVNNKSGGSVTLSNLCNFRI